MSKRYIIAGCSHGIGEAIAKQLSANGNQIISMSRTQPSSEIEGITEHFTIDFSEAVELPTIEGNIDGLVYCPGSIVLKGFNRLTEQDYLNDFRINFLGAVALINKYLPNLKASGNGSIVLFSSVAAQTGMPFHASIAASKSAVEGLTRTLAAELAPNIRVNCIAPSLTQTPLAERLTNTEEKIQNSAQKHALKRIGTSEDQANAACFLLSDAASWITGEVLGVNGGFNP